MPYPPEALCALVGDVRAYPSFIPYLQDVRVDGDLATSADWEGVAHVKVGWKHLRETFATHVRSAPSRGEVNVRLASGPFRFLTNEWRFTADGEGGSLVDFRINFAFKNAVLNSLVSMNKDIVVARLMAAFEQEAARRFAPSPS
jgi:coenzyme Q-binding protein COQ10